MQSVTASRAQSAPPLASSKARVTAATLIMPVIMMLVIAAVAVIALDTSNTAVDKLLGQFQTVENSHQMIEARELLATMTVRTQMIVGVATLVAVLAMILISIAVNRRLIAAHQTQ